MAQRRNLPDDSLGVGCMVKPSVLHKIDWKKKLNPLEYQVLREGGTERSGVGKYTNFFDTGTYYCKGCGVELYNSDDKMKSGGGWPDFETGTGQVEKTKEGSYYEIHCKNCKSHLGHIFPDHESKTNERH